MTDLVPVITSTTSVPETPTPAVIFTPVERIVRLGDLGIARENLRYGEPPDDDIPTLAATLKAAGQLQPVTVRPGRGKKEQPFMALDGRRRRLALASLLEAGDIDEDYPVRTYVETDPARQAAAVLLTNTAVPVHVADVIAAIGRMLKSKLTITAMARALGYDEIEIKRLAALSGVAPAALVALKAGRITLRQTRLLARLPDLQEQKDIAQMTLDGQGFQEWRVKERLDDSRVTTRDRRCALVDPQAYADAGGRTESDLFGELPPVLLDPDILTEVWTRRARGIAAVFEAEGISVHVTAGPEPELPDDLEALGYVYGGSLPAEEMARYRAQREVFNDRTEKARIALADVEHPDVADLAIVDMIHAKIASDQTGCGGRVVTTMVLWPAAEAGVEVRCYTPEEPEIDEEDQDAAPEAARRTAAPPAYVPPEVEAPEPETEGVNHALHAVRTDVATRGLIRALADDPGAALTALIARLFTVLVRRAHVARSDSALLEGHGVMVAAVAFPARAFAKHGTSVETGLLVMDRGGIAVWDGLLHQPEDLEATARILAGLPDRGTARPRVRLTLDAAAFLAPRERGLALPAGRLAFLAGATPLAYEARPWAGEGRDVGLYQAHALTRIVLPDPRPHPSPLVESGPMASVAPPGPTYRPVLPPAVRDEGRISDAQTETVIYAGEAHSAFLPGRFRLGEAPHEVALVRDDQSDAFTFRRGFFLGDGTGCGKGRQIAAIVADNMSQGRVRAVFVNGQQAGVERWRALITTTTQPPRTEAELMKNPLGLKIEDVSWTPDAS
ncbi:hypothetical protein KOAAANKH_00553 [Brevundimonas sp. NIBR10]|uniref:VirB8/TrbF family protein n=1 Tax=Brevundimonas sp. NIBR10 TaxID=3015997 RepID=UPI0022F18651|nr:VirB8/TrbF family protein [Brevundimonas sp. NIBR10]WGM45689.1 hypothetical protein KOAAANKH_00553 [Brevundimonas sp. NIBR10]